MAALALVPEEEEAPATEGYEFDLDFQTKITALQLRDTVFAARTDGLVQPQYFEQDLDGTIVNLAREYFTKYKKAPDWGVLGVLIKEMVAKGRVRRDLVKDLVPRLNELKAVDISDREFVIERVADFAKNKAIEAAMVASIEALGKGDYSLIEKRMKEALQVGAAEDIGEYDYWKEIEGRTQHRIDEAAGLIVPDGITTGIPALDEVLHHKGWGRKELSCLMGFAKAGKSMGLGDFGKFASLAGKNVIYFTCEVAAKIIAERTDANVSNIAMKLLKAAPDKVKEAVEKMSIGAGAFKIHEYSTGTLTNAMIRRVLDKYAQRGIQFDLIITDYADIMAPEHRSDVERENSKNIWEGLRAIAQDHNAAGLTATQSNREGGKAVTAKGTNVAEDINKIRVCDAFITINATDAERAAGEARLYFSEMRNAESGFTLRIRQDRERMKFLTAVLGRE